MRDSSRKDLSVYDFGKEDEIVESTSKGFMRKFSMSRNPNNNTTPLSKHSFLRIFARGDNVQKAEISDALCVDIDTSSSSDKCKNFGSHAAGTSKSIFPMQGVMLVLDDPVRSTSPKNDEHNHFDQDDFEPVELTLKGLRLDSPPTRVLSRELHSFNNKGLHSTLPGSPSVQKKLVDVISDDDESLEVSAQSALAPNLAEDEGAIGDPTSDHCLPDYKEMGNKVDMEIFVFPDYVKYGDRLFTRSRITFFADHIKLEDLNACGSCEYSSFEWATDNLIHIECQQSECVETSLVKIRLRPSAAVEVNIHNASDLLGIVKLEFAVSDSQWPEKKQMITTLAASYKALWNSMLDPDIAREDDDFMGQNSMFFLKRYFANFDESFEDVVYPKGDPDAVSISKRDLKLLQPETFINDTIIDFYIKYLQNKIQPEDKHRFHFFNSFFFRKLVDLDRDPRSALEGRVAFQRVRKWTRKVNIFEKDYIFIPVNFNLHWSLIVICHPGELAYFKDEEINGAPRVPCILHMDSIKGSHRGLKNLVQSYLWEEWKERHKDSTEDIAQKFLNLRFVPLELPQQENAFDCGLFLLHYVELFLEEAPVNFSPFKITKLSNFLRMDWFPPIEASHKRSTIQRLIYEILDDHSFKMPRAASSDEHHSKSLENNPKKHVMEFLSEECSQAKKACLGNLICFSAGREVDVELFHASSPVGKQIDHASSPVGKQIEKETGTVKFLGQGTGAESSCKPHPLHQNSLLQHLDDPLSPLQDEEEDGEQLACIHLDKSGNQQPDSSKGIEGTISYSSKGVGDIEISASQSVLMQPEDNGGDSLCESTSCRSPNSSEMGADEHFIPRQSRYFMSPNEREEAGKIVSVSPSTAVEHPRVPVPDSCKTEDCVVEDSLEAMDAATETKDTGDSLLSHLNNLQATCCHDTGTTDDGNCSSGDVQVISDSLESRSKCQATRRTKPLPLERPRKRTRSSLRDWQSLDQAYCF